MSYKDQPAAESQHPEPVSSTATTPMRVTVPTAADERGVIGVLEAPLVPFEIHRVYFLYGCEPNRARGAHAHRELWQFVVAVAGRVSLDFDDGLGNSTRLELDTPTQAVLVPPGYWRVLTLTNDAVCLVLASAKYEESDYIRDFEEFQRWKLSHSSN